MPLLFEAVFDWDRWVDGVGFGLGTFRWTYVGTCSVELDEPVGRMVSFGFGLNRCRPLRLRDVAETKVMIDL